MFLRRFFVVSAALAMVSTASAHPHRTRSTQAQHHTTTRAKHHAAKTRSREAHADRATRDAGDRDRADRHARSHVQSIGRPWDGHLRNPARLPPGDGYTIRRPWRSYGTHATVDLVARVIHRVRARFPKIHTLAIGDISAIHGGKITEHHSHQSGRDADLGLIYKHKPAGFPKNFVRATKANLDLAATYALVSGFAKTEGKDGGVQMMFLDFEVQGMLYKWAVKHGVSKDRLDHIFQYPHGRGRFAGLVRHEPNHANHLHVRFRCPRADTQCR